MLLDARLHRRATEARKRWDMAAARVFGQCLRPHVVQPLVQGLCQRRRLDAEDYEMFGSDEKDELEKRRLDMGKSMGVAKITRYIHVFCKIFGGFWCGVRKSHDPSGTGTRARINSLHSKRILLSSWVMVYACGRCGRCRRCWLTKSYG